MIDRDGTKRLRWDAAKQQWHVSVSIKHRRIELGYFNPGEAAVAAVDAAVLRLRSGVAVRRKRKRHEGLRLPS